MFNSHSREVFSSSATRLRREFISVVRPVFVLDELFILDEYFIYVPREWNNIGKDHAR
jgi:hypothetical protein